jgi:U3 small nucleolar RNA-associated protein 14
MTVDLDETDDEAPAKKSKVAEDDEESEDEFAADREEASDEDDEDVEEEDDEEQDEEDDDEEDEEDEEEGSDAELPSDLSDDEGPDTLEGLDSFVDELDAADRKKRDLKAVKAEIGKTKRRVLPVSSGPQASSKLLFPEKPVQS